MSTFHETPAVETLLGMALAADDPPTSMDGVNGWMQGFEHALALAQRAPELLIAFAQAIRRESLACDLIRGHDDEANMTAEAERLLAFLISHWQPAASQEAPK